MNLKKSIFSYIVWAAFVPLCCLGIVFCLQSAGLSDMLGWPVAGIVGAVCVYLLFTAAVFMALRTICMEIGRHIRDKKKFESVLCVVLPAFVLVGVVAYLVFFLVYHTPLTLEDDSFYRLALVSDGKSVPFSVHGAVWLYTMTLHVMLLVFGNTPFAGVVLQIVLFFLCLLFLYIGMQAYAGIFPAAVSMAVFGLLPVSLRYVFSLTPELFYLALYLFGFCLTGALHRRFRDKRALHPARYILIFLSGLYIGFLCYLDIYGVSLWLFLAILFSVDRGKVKQTAFAVLSALSGAAGGFLLSVLAISLTGRMAFEEYLSEFGSLYLQEFGFEADLVRQGVLLPDVTMAGSLVVISLAFFVVPSFFLWKRTQNSAFIVNLFLSYGFFLFSVFRLNGQMAVTLGWAMLAGLGLYGVVRLPDKAVLKEDTDGEDEPDESERDRAGEAEFDESESERTGEADIRKKSNSEKEGKISEKVKDEKKLEKKPERNVSEESADQEGNKALTDQEGNKALTGQEGDRILTDRGGNRILADQKGNLSEKNILSGIPKKKRRQETPAPGEPLHNPLPVPKKKKRSAADFGYQVEEADMKFDFEIKDDDDFDW